MTDLAQDLARRIAATGPLGLDAFMAACLFDPERGYYTTREVFGRAGDFTTAPEISQMFGELVGLALAQGWLDQGRPAPSVLAELGPGRGTLMRDALRATGRVPGFHVATHLHLLEASPRLRDLQRAALGNHEAVWIGGIADLPHAPLFLIANEFLDALPIRQFRRDGAGWREREVALSSGRLAFDFAQPGPVPALDHRLGDTEPGEIVELCPALPGIVARIAGQIADRGGLALVIDYGDWRSRGDTLQAVQDHRFADPLAAPGRADLTAHVDFEAVAAAAQAAGAAVTPMTPQGVWLERLGITERARALAAHIRDESALASHVAAHRRLTHPEEMGSLFKVIGIHSPETPLPPGFAT
ncbi:class I SAM-dependent methyltransferase [Tropicimonas sp. IMCC34043]|uniref:class I SAM-dependent methyltransferase n=1 Tax=Tropicimonas sp. IMCC34043 TaxID=2248760 RepID=UPI000E2378E9|nr:SAM-dependent methyltransferase [Tropicimonas sp. IMCC34043]